jgi:hypothetical protein
MEGGVVDLIMLALPLFIFLAIVLSLRRPPAKKEYKNYIRVGRKWMTIEEFRKLHGEGSPPRERAG